MQIKTVKHFVRCPSSFLVISSKLWHQCMKFSFIFLKDENGTKDF